MQIGDKISVWWASGETANGQNVAPILEIRPYTGVYTDIFTHIVKLAAPSTKRGWLEMTVNKADIDLELRNRAERLAA